LPTDDSRFIENNIPVKSIAASSAQNDSGVFELSFRDERYLPFEGAGAISDWSLELFNDLPSNNPDPGNPDFGRSLRQFDYGTISDAILHIKYTAREDAGVFKNSAITHLRNYFSDEDTEPQLRMFNLQQDFPTQWYRFLNPANPENGNVFELELSPNLFPIRDKDQNLRINTISLLARSPNTDGYQCMITGPDGPLPTITITPINQFGGLHFGQINVDIGIDLMDDPITWQLRMTRGGTDNELLQINEVENMILLLGYRRI